MDSTTENSENAASEENEVVSPVQTNGQDHEIEEPSGWLLKRSKISHKWKKQWFQVKATELHYGDEEGNIKKKIPLTGAEIAESTIESKPYTFRIKPKNSKRVYYLQAEDESSQHDWMQAICFAKAGRTDKSEACVLQ